MESFITHKTQTIKCSKKLLKEKRAEVSAVFCGTFDNFDITFVIETFKTLSESFKIRQQKEHVDSLKEFLKHEVSNLNASDDNYLNDVLRLSSWAHENQDQNLLQQISDSLPDHIKMTGDIRPSDVLSIHHMIKARSKKLCLDIGANFIGDASFMFGEQMRTILASSSDIKVRNV